MRLCRKAILRLKKKPQLDCRVYMTWKQYMRPQCFERIAFTKKLFSTYFYNASVLERCINYPLKGLKVGWTFCHNR